MFIIVLDFSDNLNGLFDMTLSMSFDENAFPSQICLGEGNETNNVMEIREHKRLGHNGVAKNLLIDGGRDNSTKLTTRR